eukprot:CAMPEP_0170065154 /NCGR_PEP_ID=MMETSP0019_2-20121128/5348_1 /TAXON_ID=98059 /ORGANISM="Dinobryon sp., Strain UTEXLB2267" /LENGTH=399 /DNA_ID=CAMNT_0010271953 /DNA_START=48 /DNA_END=1247 /DNA_ORIENTATION=+
MTERHQQSMQVEAEVIENPVVALYTVGLNSSDTLYDKLNGLADEIKSGILNLSKSSSLSGIDRRALVDEIEALRDASYRERSPEAVLNILLFRKYADLANQINDSCNASKDKQLFINAIGDTIPAFVYRPQEGELVGWNAIQSSIFWLRISTCVFSFVSYVIMSTVPHIADIKYYPALYFTEDCPSIDGFFRNSPFQAVIAVGVLAYAHSLLLSIYYWLPVNAEKQKFIPGLSYLLGQCMSPSTADSVLTSAAQRFKAFLRLIELVSDSLMLVLSLVTVLVASIVLERGAKFEDLDLNSVTYYTMGTFFTTFTNTNPPCVDKDPSPLIRASLAMMYLAVFTIMLCFLNSLNSFRMEMRTRVLSSSQQPQASGGSGMGIGVDGEDFRALPVPTQDDEEAL